MPKNAEHYEQKALFLWAEYQAKNTPELSLLFSIPNGGQRNIIIARKLKDEGVKAGVPDMYLPVARGSYHGLFIELKSKDGVTSKNQDLWLRRLEEQGYMAQVCYGWQEAKEEIEKYLALKLAGDHHG